MGPSGPIGTTREDLAAALRPLPAFAHIDASDLIALETDSVSHTHWCVGKMGLLLRQPRFSHWDQDAAFQLAYEAECFRRAEASGHTPCLASVVKLRDTASGGFLVVTQIEGIIPDLGSEIRGAHMSSIAEALAAIHTLSVPNMIDRTPLISHENAVTDTLLVIKRQLSHLDEAGLPAKSHKAIEDELAWANNFAVACQDLPAQQTLVGTDTHPGNFLIDAAGKAWFVDLEKMLYGHPAIDLAHATLPTSTGWDRRISGRLSAADTRDFYAQYLKIVGDRAAQTLRPWTMPMRRLTWLRTMSWFVRWRADWSTDNAIAPSHPALETHIDTHISWCFDPTNIDSIRSEWLEGAN